MQTTQAAETEFRTAVEQIYLNHTQAALEDKLTHLLSSKTECDVYYDSDMDNEWLIHPFYPYVNQAEGLLYRINIYNPLPKFVIWDKDIPLGLAVEIKKLGNVAMNKVITNAVRRLYESIDPEYYHTNGIHGKVRWRFGKA